MSNYIDAEFYDMWHAAENVINEDEGLFYG